jgi:hypothetical protein
MINEKERIYLRVVQWDGTKGLVVDRQKFQYEITREHLAPECDGEVAIGDLVSGVVKDFETIFDVLIEAGSNPISERKELSERKEFSSVGPYAGAQGWTPRIGNPNYSTGKPDTGDSRTRGKL